MTHTLETHCFSFPLLLYPSTPVLYCVFQTAVCILPHCLQMKQEQYYKHCVHMVQYLSTPVLCGVFQAAECILQHCLQLKQEQEDYKQLTQALETHCFKIFLASGVETNIDNISGNASCIFIVLYFHAGAGLDCVCISVNFLRSCLFHCKVQCYIIKVTHSCHPSGFLLVCSIVKCSVTLSR